MRYDCTKAVQTFTAKANKKYVIDLLGASGYSGTGTGGYGGHVQAVYQNTADTTLNIYVGGTPAEDTFYTGGWNGGGNAGAVSTRTDPYGYYVSRGGGGGGATDIRIGGTATNNRVMVAGGGGGSGVYISGGNGGSWPKGAEGGNYYSEWVGSVYFTGMPGTTSSGGLGGAAPYYITYTETSNQYGTYYRTSGGGGGGGYYGGGGGSTGLVFGNRGVRSSGYAGTAGTLATGGAGAGNTSGVSGTGAGDSGGGGGGSSYIATNAQISFPTYDQCWNDRSANGYALISEVISAPVIKDIYRNGSDIYVRVSKEERADNAGIEERFYYTFSLDTDSFTRKKSPKSSVVVLDKEDVEIKYTIDSSLALGHHRLYFHITSADNRFVETDFDFDWKDAEATVTFNTDVLNAYLMQGTKLENVFSGTGLFTGATNLIYESQIMINGKEFGGIQSGYSKSIILPYIYDGVYKSIYEFQLKVRIGHIVDGVENSLNKEVWSKWFESETYLVHAPVIPINRVKFNNKLSDKAIEMDTKLKLSWQVDPNLITRSSNIEYILYLYHEDEVLFEKNYGQQTETTLIMSYPQGENYRFAIALLQDGMFLSELNYSESFQIADISTDSKVTLSNDMTLVTTLNEEFDRIEVSINGEIDFVRTTNLNEAIPNWKLRGGHNIIEVFVYLTASIYVKHTFKVYLHVINDDVSNVSTHSFKAYISVNNEKNYEQMLSINGSSVVGLGISDEEYESLITDTVVEEVTQRITIQNSGSDHELKIFEIFGSLD